MTGLIETGALRRAAGLGDDDFAAGRDLCDVVGSPADTAFPEHEKGIAAGAVRH